MLSVLILCGLHECLYLSKVIKLGFPWWSKVVKTLPSSTGGSGLIPDQVTKIPHASRPKAQNIKQKQYCNRFNKGFKNGPHQKKNKNKKIFKKKMIQLYILFVSL